MTICPRCEESFGGAAASSGPEPECLPGFICPNCQEFVFDYELDEQDEAERTFTVSFEYATEEGDFDD